MRGGPRMHNYSRQFSGSGLHHETVRPCLKGFTLRREILSSISTTEIGAMSCRAGPLARNPTPAAVCGAARSAHPASSSRSCRPAAPELVLEVDDLVEPRAEQVNRVRRHILLRPHRFLLSVVIERPSESRTVGERNPQNQNARFVAFTPPKLAIPKRTSAAKTILLQRLGCCPRSTNKGSDTANNGGTRPL